MRLSNLAAMIAASLIAISPAAAEQAVPTYLLSATLTDGGALVGKPRLMVKANAPTRFEIGNGGGDSYAVTMTAMPQSNGTLLVASSIELTSRANGHLSAQPRLTVRPGEKAAFALGKEARPFRIDFTFDSTAS